MISTVSLLGQADDILKEHPTFRLINLETIDAFEEKVTVNKIPVTHFHLYPRNTFWWMNHNKKEMIVFFCDLQTMLKPVLNQDQTSKNQGPYPPFQVQLVLVLVQELALVPAQVLVLV